MDTAEAAWADLEQQQDRARQRHEKLMHSQAAAKADKVAARMQSQQILATAPCAMPRCCPAPSGCPQPQVRLEKQHAAVDGKRQTTAASCCNQQTARCSIGAPSPCMVQHQQ